jgi:myosin-1
VCPGKGERSYHIFYQVLSAPALCDSLALETSPSSYATLKASGTYTIDGGSNDAEDLKYTLASMDTVGMDEEAKKSYFEIVRRFCLG